MKVLIIGLGSIAKKHITALREINSKVEIVGLRSSVNSENVLGVNNIFSLDDINSKSIDFAIISSPTSKHLENIKSLVKFGIPLFIEKPLFHTLEIEQIIPEIKKKNIKTYVACNLRFLDSLNFMRNKIKEDNLRINEVTVYCGSYLPEWRENKKYKEIYSAIPELGGGVHLDLIHEIDYVYWIFGKPNKVHKILTNSSSLEVNSVDYANYNLQYSTFNASIILNYFRRKASRYFELVCEDGTYKVDLLNNKVFFEDELIYHSTQEVIDTYEKQLKYFITNIKNKTFNDIEEALVVLKICL